MLSIPSEKEKSLMFIMPAFFAPILDPFEMP
jgi:hypothetical protein